MGAAKHLSTLTRRNVRSSADTLIGPEVILCGAGGHTPLALRNTILFSSPSPPSVSANGSWAEWLAWSTCTASCDGGTQFRERYCLGQCARDAYNQARNCNTHYCNCGGKGFSLSLSLSLSNTSIHFPLSTHSQ